MELGHLQAITSVWLCKSFTKESLLKHRDEHGAVSLLTSAKFGRYAGCFLEEIERVIAAEPALIAPAEADDATGNQDAAAPPADEATESPAALRARFQSRRFPSKSGISMAM